MEIDSRDPSRRTPTKGVIARHENNYMMAFQLCYHSNMDMDFLVRTEPLNIVRTYYTMLQEQRKLENEAARGRH